MSLHHRHQAVVHRQELAEITHIMGHRIEVHLQHRSVTTTLQMMTYTLKLMLAITLQKYCSVLYILLLQASHQSLGRWIKLATLTELFGIGCNTLTNTDKLLHSGILHKLRHTAIKLLVVHSALQNIRHDSRSLRPQRHATQRIESHCQRVDVGVIAVVYKR